MKLQIRDLCKQFAGRPVLEHVSLELESGQIYCLMAPSGTGKTTLFRILMGLETADGGEIRIVTDIADPGVRKAETGNACVPGCSEGALAGMSGWKAVLPEVRIAAVFQEDRMCEGFSAVDNVLMTASPSMTRKDAEQELLELLPQEALNRPVSTLSGGQKRRVAICRALCAPSDLLILDEPFTGLDADTKNDVIRYLQKKSAGKLTLLSTHQEEDISALSGIQITLS